MHRWHSIEVHRVTDESARPHTAAPGEPQQTLTGCESHDATTARDSLDDWFKREVLVHEGALVRFIARSWPNRDDITDFRQDTYVRVYEAAAKARPLQPKSFLFATARHLMTDKFRRRRVVAIDSVGDLESLNVMMRDPGPEECASAQQELRRLAVAIDKLPARCREVVWLRRVDEIPQKEVALQLCIAQKTVEKHVMKGVKLLANALGRGQAEHSQDHDRMSQEERPNEVSDVDETMHGRPSGD
jgi:RNA polymerase sigma-70 factor (ECF subfamily)